MMQRVSFLPGSSSDDHLRLLPRRMVIDRNSDRLVNLFGRQKNDRFGANGSGSYSQRDGGGSGIVGSLGDHVGIVFSEREIEPLEAAAHALQHFFDGRTASCSTLLDKSFNPFWRVGNHCQILRHNFEQVNGSSSLSL